MQNADEAVLLQRRDGGVLWLTMNRPTALNAIDRELGLELLRAFRSAEQDGTVRAIVLTGAGRAFCAGDDIAGLKAFLDGDMDHPRAAVDPSDRSSLYMRVAALITRCPKPVIAAVNGPAFGAGTELACAADIRCMARSARIGSGLVRIAQVGNAAYLGHVIGHARAFEIFATGRAVDPVEAGSIGLSSHVFEDAEFIDRVGELARQLADGPTRVIAMQKRLLAVSRGRGLDERAALQEAAHQRCFFEAGDAREGARAFIDKRPAAFKGT
ncbi:enoyl-CoA hydratase-related protein [Niveispirillum sp.]|uniref:enoyl-CoA hydratase/isomerase family protein n=1 Tax=Niveispirillum sp. TaxID=1917217 RepID=UPI001B4E6151|nr:enoyl-CoA hydratase-related protein [Niveispirillum sp.]MBP7338510.1 enoyl-CoA hydratase/isomerase family protein [Niveispirillum sp.]